MTTHTCSYYCDRPECIKAQRGELRGKLEAAEAQLADIEKDAARYRWLRWKMCFSGNGDGTCTMEIINLPNSIPGWPERIDLHWRFCDNAIDAAMKEGKK